jgi:hypothetical protein
MVVGSVTVEGDIILTVAIRNINDVSIIVVIVGDGVEGCAGDVGVVTTVAPKLVISIGILNLARETKRGAASAPVSDH